MRLGWRESYGCHQLLFHPSLPEIFVDWDGKNDGYRVSFGRLILKKRFRDITEAKKLGVLLAIQTWKKGINDLELHQGLESLIEKTASK